MTIEDILTDIKKRVEQGKNFSCVCGMLVRKSDIKNVIIENTEFLNQIRNIRPSDRVWCLLNNISSEQQIPICQNCGIHRVHFSKIGCFSKTCCKRCGTLLGAKLSKSPENIRKAEETKKRVFMEKYGVDHVSKIPEVKLKKNKTAIKNYGSLKAAYYDTSQNTIYKRYGVDNISKLDLVKEKKKETSRKNYGTDYPWQSEKGKEEQQNGVKQKYDVDNVSQCNKIKEKKIHTTRKNYGVDNPFQFCYIKNQIKINLFFKYGIFNVSDLEEVKEKKRQTSMKNFGVNHHMKTSAFKMYFRLLMIERLKNLCGQISPNYNPNACRLIEEYGKEHGYKFQHAENGGEYFIKELGYWVDGYDMEKNVVLEVDEPYHFDSQGILHEYDFRRQGEIEEFLGCKFIRLRIYR